MMYQIMTNKVIYDNQKNAESLLINSSANGGDKEAEKLSPAISSKHEISDKHVAKPVPPPPSQPPKKKKETLSLEETVLLVKQREKEKMDQEKRCKRLVEEDMVGVTFRKKIRVVAGTQNVRVANREEHFRGKSGEGTMIRFPVTCGQPIRPTVQTQEKRTSPPPSVAVVIRPSRPHVTPSFQSMSHSKGSQVTPTRDAGAQTVTPESNQHSFSAVDPRLSSRRSHVTPIQALSQITTRDYGTMTSLSLLNAEQFVSARELQPVPHCPMDPLTSSSGKRGQANEPHAPHCSIAMTSGTPPPQNLPSTSASNPPPSSFPADPSPTFPPQQQQFPSPTDFRRSSQVRPSPVTPPPPQSPPLLRNESAPKSVTRAQQSLPQPQRTPGLPLIPTSTFKSVSQQLVPIPSASTSTISSQPSVVPGFYTERSECVTAPVPSSSSSHSSLSTSTSRDPRLATTPPRSSSPEETKPSLKDLPLLPPEPIRSLVPFDDKDDDVIPLEDDEPVPWTLHKINLTESEPLYRRSRSPSRSSSNRKCSMILIDTMNVTNRESPIDNTKVFHGMRWPEPQRADERNPVLHIDNRRFIRKKKPAPPPILVDLVMSPESKKREDERKRKREAEKKRRRLEEQQNKQRDEMRKKKEEEVKKQKNVPRPSAPPDRPQPIFTRPLTTRLPTPPPSPPGTPTSNQTFSAVARDTTVVSSFLTSTQHVPLGPPVEALQSLLNDSSAGQEVEPYQNPQVTPVPPQTLNPPANLPPITPIFPPLPKVPPPGIPPPLPPIPVIPPPPWLPPPGLPPPPLQFYHRPGMGPPRHYRGQISQMQHSPFTYNHNGYYAPPQIPFHPYWGSNFWRF